MSQPTTPNRPLPPTRTEPRALAPDALAAIVQARAFAGRGALGMIDWANHKPENKGRKPKVGGHQASSLSSLDILCALYLHVLQPGDRVAVKPHAAPALYALMQMMGRVTATQMGSLREKGGLQPYPTPAKNPDFVDYTSSSEGLGVAATIYDALTARLQNVGLGSSLGAAPIAAVHYALCGDGELTEGQVDESLYDAGRWQLPGLVWIVDLNRQSLDRVMDDTGHLDRWVEQKFAAQGWQVEQLRWGERARALFSRPGGATLQASLLRAPDAVLHTLTLVDGATARALLLGRPDATTLAAVPETRRGLVERCAALWPRDDAERAAAAEALAGLADDAVADAIGHLGGHDIPLLCDALQRAAAAGRPVCLVAHTVKGFGTSLAGHPENHGALMPTEEALAFGAEHGVPVGEPWPLPPPDSPAAALTRARAALLFDGPVDAPFDHGVAAPPLDLEAALPPLRAPARKHQSTGEAFQSVVVGLLRTPAAPYLHAGAPDVGQTTHLGPLIRETGVFAPRELPDAWDFLRAERALAFDWRATPTGQFHALGIAEGNAMLWAGAMGRPRKAMEGRPPLLPIVTVYDKFVERAVNQLDVALYSGSRFVLVGVPSGTGLSRETATHQSVATPRIVMDTPGICSWEPAFAADVAVIVREALCDLWRPQGESHYLRLTTQPLDQPEVLPDDHAEGCLRGAYWWQDEALAQPAAGRPTVVLAAAGRKVSCARAAAARLHEEDGLGVQLLVVTSFERLWRSWDAWQTDPDAWERGGHALDTLFADDALLHAPMVVVADATPSVAEWMGSALQRLGGLRVLGPRRWSEAGDLEAIDRLHGMHADDIVAAIRAEVRFRASH